MSMIMKIDGIKGESLIDKHIDEIDLLSIDHDIRKPMLADKSSNQRTTDRAYHSDFVVRMRCNKSYPLLLKACNNSTCVKDVSIYLTKTDDGQTIDTMVYKLTFAYISQVNIVPESEDDKVTKGTSDSTLPLIEVSLNYQAIDVVYKPNTLKGDQSGNVSSGPLTGLGGGQ